MTYNKTNWVSGETLLSAENFNKMEKGIEDAHIAAANIQNLLIVLSNGIILSKEEVIQIASNLNVMRQTAANLIEIAEQLKNTTTPEPPLGDSIPIYNTSAILGKLVLGAAVLGKKQTLPKLITPVIYFLDESLGKLSTPTIRLEDSSEVQKPSDSIISNSSSILGEAVLGKTILNCTTSLPKLHTPIVYLVDDSTPKLNTPIIYLLEETTKVLSTPTIWLENIHEDITPDEPEIPDEPSIQKLTTPNIYMYIEEVELPEEPVEPEEPEIPKLTKLETPNIYLYTEEPVEPEEPEFIKLNTPIIFIETFVAN